MALYIPLFVWPLPWFCQLSLLALTMQVLGSLFIRFDIYHTIDFLLKLQLRYTFTTYALSTFWIVYIQVCSKEMKRTEWGGKDWVEKRNTKGQFLLKLGLMCWKRKLPILPLANAVKLSYYHVLTGKMGFPEQTCACGQISYVVKKRSSSSVV